MGCDIHLCREKQIGGEWVYAGKWDANRNYDLFGLLAKGVRTEHPLSFEQRGVPYNASAEYCARYTDNPGW